MLTTIEIDGVEYHAQGQNYDEDTDCYEYFSLILDEDGEPIPATTCLCFAREPSECLCGAWDDVADWSDSDYNDSDY